MQCPGSGEQAVVSIGRLVCPICHRGRSIGLPAVGPGRWFVPAHEPVIKPAGMVPVGSPKGSQVTNTFDPKAVQEKYEGEKQEWTDYLTEMRDAIDRGLCDEILKPLARAIFDRRDVLNGHEPGHSFRNAKSAAESSNGRAGTPPSLPVAGGHITPPAHATNLDSGGAFVGVVPPTTPAVYGAKVELGGKLYLKKDILGLVIRVPSTLRPQYIHGLRVKVTGVGTKRVKVEWVDKPPANTSFGKSADQPTFLPLNSLSHILG